MEKGGGGERDMRGGGERGGDGRRCTDGWRRSDHCCWLGNVYKHDDTRFSQEERSLRDWLVLKLFHLLHCVRVRSLVYKETVSCASLQKSNRLCAVLPPSAMMRANTTCVVMMMGALSYRV